MFTPFKKLYISLEQMANPDVLYSLFNKLQTNIEASFAPLNKTQNDSTVIQNVALTTGSNVVNHKLNRKLLGWSIVGRTNGAIVYDNQANNASPELTLTLVTDQDVTVNILVF